DAGTRYLRRRIGMVHQNHQLLFDRTVVGNVALPWLIAPVSPPDVGARVNGAPDKVAALQERASKPMVLSGGEQQRVVTARAVVNKPRLLWADEPTGNLDPELSADIMNLFAEFAQVGVTVLIATHDLDLIQHYSHRWMALREGELVQDVVSR